MPLLEQVLENNPDTVKIILKNMPLGFHKYAEPAARAALAAGKQGKFWEFHDELFATAPELGPEEITGIATKLGLDLEKFKLDMESDEIAEKVKKDLSDAQDAGVTGTPTIFINGIKLKSRTFEAIQKLIDEELAKKG